MSDRVSGQTVAFNITSTGVVAKTSPGRACMLHVITAGAQGSINDCASVGAAAIGNQVAAIPAVAGSYLIDMPCYTAITVVPGAGQVCTLSYV